MSKRTKQTDNQVYICQGCHKYCQFSIKKQHETLYRPAINNKIIYDYKTSNDFYDRNDALCFTPQNAQKLIRFFMNFCTENHTKSKSK